MLVGVAHIYDALNDSERAMQVRIVSRNEAQLYSLYYCGLQLCNPMFSNPTQFYKSVLFYDASNIESIACLASQHFYTDQPEVALR